MDLDKGTFRDGVLGVLFLGWRSDAMEGGWKAGEMEGRGVGGVFGLCVAG
jgi:hypothetical protein